MKKRIVLFCIVLAAMSVCARAEQAVIKSVPGTQGMQVGAKAAIVIEVSTGRVLFAQDEHEPLPIASTTKIMTALIALEQNNIDAEFPVNSAAIHVEGSSMGLREGDKASLRALATGMLLSSGNDAANAAAVRISGSIPDFVSLMNERARELGMTGTSFETPSGLDGDAHYSTAYDMAQLTRVALRNDVFVSICSQYRMRTSFGNPPENRWLVNHNKLLNYYEGTFGVKTGFTKKAGRCLVSAARRDGIELICVTLDCPDDWTIHQNLYDRFFGELKLEDLSLGLKDLSVPVTGGISGSVSAVCYEPAPVPVPVSDADVRYEISLAPFLYAPVLSGQHVGEARIFLDEQLVFTLSLVAGHGVDPLYEYKEEKNILEQILGFFNQ